MASLAKLVASPRVQYLGKQLRGTLPQASGPFITPNRTTNSNRNPGAYANLGGIVAQAARTLGASTNQPQTQQVDPLMSLYQQLVEQLQAPVDAPTGIDTANLMSQVRSAIDPIYDQRAKSAQDRTGRATKEVKDMYGALAQDYEKLAPQQIEQANAAKAQIEQMYGQLRSNLEGSYSRVSKEQGDLFKSLGIEDALPDVLANQAPAVLQATQAASQNEAQQQQRYIDMGNIDSTFYREGSPNAKMAGNNISTDFLNQLQDYLGQVEAERSSGIQTGYLDQLGQAQTRLAQQQQNAQAEAGRRREMLWQMLSSQLKGSQATALTPDTFMAQLPQNQQQAVAGAFTRLQRSPEAIYGKVEDPRQPVPGTYVDTGPEWYMAQADKMLANGEIDEQTHQALLMYLQLNFKK